jgi:hypothetical protein
MANTGTTTCETTNARRLKKNSINARISTIYVNEILKQETKKKIRIPI